MLRLVNKAYVVVSLRCIIFVDQIKKSLILTLPLFVSLMKKCRSQEKIITVQLKFKISGFKKHKHCYFIAYSQFKMY